MYLLIKVVFLQLLPASSTNFHSGCSWPSYDLDKIICSRILSIVNKIFYIFWKYRKDIKKILDLMIQTIFHSSKQSFNTKSKVQWKNSMRKYFCQYCCCNKEQKSLHFYNSFNGTFPAFISFWKINQNIITARLVLRNQYTQNIISMQLKGCNIHTWGALFGRGKIYDLLKCIKKSTKPNRIQV